MWCQLESDQKLVWDFSKIIKKVEKVNFQEHRRKCNQKFAGLSSEKEFL